MARRTLYEDVVTHRRQSVFPEDTQVALRKVGTALGSGSSAPADLQVCLQGFELLSPADIVRASAEIRDFGQFYAMPRAGWRLQLAHILGGDPGFAGLSALFSRSPALARILVFHGSGHVRQAALEALNEAPVNMFEFAALVYRLNDWVPEVRAAAASTYRRLAADIPAQMIAESSIHLLPRAVLFSRWSLREKGVYLDSAFRQDVAEAVGRVLMGRPLGRIGRFFRVMLQRPGLDRYLTDLAKQAQIPLVRAIAYETLITRQARWFEGHNWRWLDKRYGIKQRGPAYERRRLEHDHDIEALIRDGAADRSIVVRKTVAQAMVEARGELTEAVLPSARTLAEDPSPSVRLHAEFFLRNFR